MNTVKIELIINLPVTVAVEMKQNIVGASPWKPTGIELLEPPTLKELLTRLTPDDLKELDNAAYHFVKSQEEK